MLEELSPFGVIASITPSTNPVASVYNNTICMIAGGNGVVFAPHPGAVKCSLRAVELVTRSLAKQGAPEGLVVTLTQPSMENLKALMTHRTVRLIAATGGPGVVKAALSSGKPAIGAGPGNPPVVVDETADIRKAALDVILGCSFDNNLPCIAEKELFVVNCVADELKKHMLDQGAFELKEPDLVKRLQELVLNPDHSVNRSMVGKSAPYYLEKLGIKVGANVRVVLVETTEDHPFVQEELLMPILPLVRVADFDEALCASLRAEHGFRHSAAIHSTNITHMSRMARAMETTIFTKNAPSFASIGVGGDCPTAFTIATTTGQGPTTPLSFCRTRRCVLAGAFPHLGGDIHHGSGAARTADLRGGSRRRRGAGFPTHVKLKAKGIDTYLINGAECEPLLTVDQHLMCEEAPRSSRRGLRGGGPRGARLVFA